MTGIDDDERPGVGIGRRLRAETDVAAGVQAAVLHGDAVQEALAVGGGKIDHQPRRLVVGGGEREGFVHPHRPLGVEHDAGTALHDQAEAERLDQAAAVLAGLRRQLEGHLRQVNHHPVRIGEREGRHIDFLRQIHDKPCLLVVAADPDVGGDRKRR